MEHLDQNGINKQKYTNKLTSTQIKNNITNSSSDTKDRICVCVCVCVRACTCGHKLLIFKQQQKTSKLTNKRRKRSPVSFAFARNYVSYTVKSQCHACGSATAKYTQRTCIFCTDTGTVLVKYLYVQYMVMCCCCFVCNQQLL